MSLFSPLESPLPLLTPTPLIDNLPDLFVNINEGENDFTNGLIPAEQTAFDALDGSIDRVYKNIFIQSADDDALTDKEALYWQVTGFWGDNVMPAVIVTRQDRLLRRRFQTTPFTLGTLTQFAMNKFRQSPGTGYATAYMNTAVTPNYKLGAWHLGQLPFISYPNSFFLEFPAPTLNLADAAQAMWGATYGVVDPAAIYWITMQMKPAHLTFIPKPTVQGACSTATWSGGSVVHQAHVGIIEGGYATITPISIGDPVGGVYPVTYLVPSTTTGCVTSVQLQQSGGGSVTGLPVQTVYIPIPSGSSILMTHYITVS
jgi:hypothetical protein